MNECLSCANSTQPEADIEQCPNSQRPCGHHCNCSWMQDVCDWCGAEFGDVNDPQFGVPNPANVMDKPIVAVAFDSQEIPEKLRLIADEVVILPDGVNPAAADELTQAMNRVLKKKGLSNDRGRSLNAVAQIRLLDDPSAQHGNPPWAAIPLYEGQVEFAVTWLRNNHATLVRHLAEQDRLS